MKKFHNRVLPLGAAVAAAMLLGVSGAANAGIAATKHNLAADEFFTGGGTVTRTVKSDSTEICVFCHTPHSALVNGSIPLWNHTLSTDLGGGSTTYGVYTSDTLDASSANGGDIAALTTGADAATALANATVSNLCLSCHDGTVAINSLSNFSNSQPTITMAAGSVDPDGTLLDTASTNLGTSLSDDHPVNFTYATVATADASIKAATGDTVGAAKLFGGKLQCASCHDPHDSVNRPFLRASMSGSGLCLECHDK